MTLWSDGKTSEEIQKLSEVDGNSVAYNLHEDLLCVKEDLAKANERVELLEKCCKLHTLPPNVVFDMVEAMIPHEVNKFAIEKKVEALEDVLQSYVPAKFYPTTYAIQAFNDGVSHLFAHIQERTEQLRKEQE